MILQNFTYFHLSTLVPKDAKDLESIIFFSENRFLLLSDILRIIDRKEIFQAALNELSSRCSS